MSTLTLTIFLAFVFVMLAMVGLGIGWLLTGKSILKAGACGRDPNKKVKDEDCGKTSSCGLCKKPDDKIKQ